MIGLTIKQQSVNVSILRRPRTVQVNSNTPIVSHSLFVPFTFTAAQGQTSFELPFVPLIVMLLVINGAPQDQAAGDFTMNGTAIITNGPLNDGDKVYGIYQTR
jgi:hypothetical protein